MRPCEAQLAAPAQAHSRLQLNVSTNCHPQEGASSLAPTAVTWKRLCILPHLPLFVLSAARNPRLIKSYNY